MLAKTLRPLKLRFYTSHFWPIYGLFLPTNIILVCITWHTTVAKVVLFLALFVEMFSVKKDIATITADCLTKWNWLDSVNNMHIDGSKSKPKQFGIWRVCFIMSLITVVFTCLCSVTVFGSLRMKSKGKKYLQLDGMITSFGWRF